MGTHGQRLNQAHRIELGAPLENQYDEQQPGTQNDHDGRLAVATYHRASRRYLRRDLYASADCMCAYPALPPKSEGYARDVESICEDRYLSPDHLKHPDHNFAPEPKGCYLGKTNFSHDPYTKAYTKRTDICPAA